MIICVGSVTLVLPSNWELIMGCSWLPATQVTFNECPLNSMKRWWRNFFSQQTMWRPRFWKNRVTMQHATFGAWEFFFSLCCQDRLLVILMISIQYSEPVNSSFATMKKTKLISRRLLPQDLKTPPKTSSEGLKIRRVPSVSALGWMDIDYFVILSSSILTTGLARASTVLTRATGRLYLHLQRYGITLLCSFFPVFQHSSRLHLCLYKGCFFYCSALEND